jgi:hypothetical protein
MMEFFRKLLRRRNESRINRVELSGRFPPIPKWRPVFAMPLETLIERFEFYTNYERDFVVFEHGTIVTLEAGLDDAAAVDFARRTLEAIINFHPDVTPSRMNDGNVMVQYNHPAISLVLTEEAQAHWQEIEQRHQDGLTPGEVLQTPDGPNRFDEFGKLVLLGRAYMFMDAQALKVVRIVRAQRPPQ